MDAQNKELFKISDNLVFLNENVEKHKGAKRTIQFKNTKAEILLFDKTDTKSIQLDLGFWIHPKFPSIVNLNKQCEKVPKRIKQALFSILKDDLLFENRYIVDFLFPETHSVKGNQFCKLEITLFSQRQLEYKTLINETIVIGQKIDEIVADSPAYYITHKKIK